MLNSSGLSIVSSPFSRNTPSDRGCTCGQCLLDSSGRSIFAHIILARFVDATSRHSFHVSVPGRYDSSPAGKGGCTSVVSSGRYFVDNGNVGHHLTGVKIAEKNGIVCASSDVSGGKTLTLLSPPFALDRSNLAKCFGMLHSLLPIQQISLLPTTDHSDTHH